VSKRPEEEVDSNESLMKLFMYFHDSMIDGSRVTMPVIVMLNVRDCIRANDRQVLTLIHANDLALFFECCDQSLLVFAHPHTPRVGFLESCLVLVTGRIFFTNAYICS